MNTKKRHRLALSAVLTVFVLAGTISAQESAMPKAELPIFFEELTAPEFIQAVTKSEATCIIPLGILEKHGPHLPLGTDLIDCREVARRAADQEYTIIFPAYFVGQIFEAKHQPGTIAYSAADADLPRRRVTSSPATESPRSSCSTGTAGTSIFSGFSARPSWPTRRTMPSIFSTLHTTSPWMNN